MPKNKQQKVRASFVQKFPDSERGETKQRASFLGEVSQFGDKEQTNNDSFEKLNKMMLSPTKGNKTPFSKTPRAKVGGEAEEGKEEEGKEEERKEEEGKEEKENEEVEKNNGQRKNKFSVFLSKYYNKR